MAIQAVLEHYKERFENLTPQTMNQEFLMMFDREVYYKNPFNEVRGLKELQRVLEHTLTTYYEPEIRIHQMAGVDKSGYLEWRFYYKLKPTGEAKHINGITKILINDQQKVLVHIDYWDAGEFVYLKIPLLGGLISWVNKRLTAK